MAVALSQYMYYTHFKDGVPATSVTHAIITSDGLDYTFGGASSTIWNYMAKKSADSNTNAVALLLGNVGRQINSNYKINSTTANTSNAKAYLSEVYGVTFTLETFDFEKVVSEPLPRFSLCWSGYQVKIALPLLRLCPALYLLVAGQGHLVYGRLR